jgi:hypothetical protein
MMLRGRGDTRAKVRALFDLGQMVGVVIGCIFLIIIFLIIGIFIFLVMVEKVMGDFGLEYWSSCVAVGSVFTLIVFGTLGAYWLYEWSHSDAKTEA